MRYCCAEFEKQAGYLQAPVGGRFLYPPTAIPLAQFEKDDDGAWAINGCCGGGCYVVTGMRFCPYCGAKLT